MRLTKQQLTRAGACDAGIYDAENMGLLDIEIEWTQENQLWLVALAGRWIGWACSAQLLPPLDLSGANLSGANLSGANLSGADLSGADLSKADDEATR